VIEHVVREQQYLGSYRLLKLVGSGRKCQVWDAMHDAKAERRACKIVMPQYEKDAEQLGLIRREFEAANELNHPNVIRVYEFNHEPSPAFLAMEYFPSVNLKQLLLQEREDAHYRLTKIITEAAAGLDHVHEHNWIHRDIKPDNFLVGADDKVKLIDFALAERKRGFLGKLFGGKSKVQGTRSYMSPEQVRAASLDHRTDIYSFGCTVFEMLAGRPPFTGASTNDLLNKHLRTAPPSLEAMNRNVTTEFSNLIKKTMAKNPADRPQSMAEFLTLMKAHRIFKTQPRKKTETESESA